jgi:hypothetical protein
MTTHTQLQLPARLHALAAMASLLERLDRHPRGASAGQYQGVVEQVKLLLGQAEPGAEFDALLAVAPATAEVYENLHYEQAGLCRSPLEAALNAELAAGAALARAAARPSA